MQPLLTPEQLAERLNLHPETVRRLSRENKIPYLLVGGSYRYDWAAVETELARPAKTLPDHLRAQFVNALRDCANQYAGTQQLRAQLARVVTEALG